MCPQALTPCKIINHNIYIINGRETDGRQAVKKAAARARHAVRPVFCAAKVEKPDELTAPQSPWIAMFRLDRAVDCIPSPAPFDGPVKQNSRTMLAWTGRANWESRSGKTC